jgi:hypothetical protein
MEQLQVDCVNAMEQLIFHITVPLTSCFENKTKIVSCHTADSKPGKQEVKFMDSKCVLNFVGIIRHNYVAEL